MAWEAFYTSEEAERYRVNLKNRVKKKLDGASTLDMGGLELCTGETPNAMRSVSEDSIDAELYLAGTDQKHLISTPLVSEEIYDDRATRVYSATFYCATLGLSLRKDPGANSAYVSLVSARGQAEIGCT